MTLATLSTVFTASLAPIPSPDPLGFPLPIILIQALAYFTLTLHFLAVNFTLGGLMLLIWARLRKKPGHDVASKFFRTGLPLGTSYLVTLGIPPLLFLQVLYGQLFYSSSILIGGFWILVIPVLITAYALLYVHKLTSSTHPLRQSILLGVALVFMLFVGFLYVNNITLSTTPERWMEMYAAHPGGGTLNLGEPTLTARFLLFVSPTLVVAGLALILVGNFLGKWRTREHGAPVAKFGIKSILVGRLFMVASATLMVLSLPDDIRATVFGGGLPTILLGSGLGLALLATGTAFFAAHKGSPAVAVVSFIVLTLELASFVALRDHVRLAYLADHFDLTSVPVNNQWGMFGIFMVSMVAGLLFLIFMTYKVVMRALDSAKENWRATDKSN